MGGRPGGHAERVLGREPIETAATPAPYKYTRRRARAKGAAPSRIPRGWWVKLRTGLLNDAAVMLLPDATFRRLVELTLVAAEQDPRDGSLPALQEVAWRLRVSEAQLEGELAQLQAIGKAEHTAAGWTLPRFVAEQDAETSGERVAAWRERQAGRRVGNDGANDPANAAVTKRYAEGEGEGEREGDPPASASPASAKTIPPRERPNGGPKSSAYVSGPLGDFVER